MNSQINSANQYLNDWLKQVVDQVQPSQVKWCDGSDEEYDQLVSDMVASQDLMPLNQETYPNCFLYRSHPDDVARSEHLTYICTKEKSDVGDNNNWLSSQDGHQRVDPLFAGSMKGRTMYVIPYCMGPLESPYAQFGVEVTDSPYVVVNMKKMTTMGSQVLEKINHLGPKFVRGLHCTGDLSPNRRWIMHFPEEMMIKSFGSGYGGNALLGKKCHALRLASYQAKQEGWLAEHMLIVGIENPQGEKVYVAAAFPSACGKTNLAMLIPPESYPGWKIWTVGDDIAWLFPGDDGRLWAINPEAGFFGVAPGTSEKTNPHAFHMLRKNTLFTNVGLTASNEPWWEGKDKSSPAYNWRGQSASESTNSQPFAHPNARFTVSCAECSSYEQQPPGGVPISAILFGSRRAELVPLVFQAKNWLEGVLAGAAMCSETTAAATGEIGVLRNDPMAMKPFCGYNFGDYWAHWIEVGKKLSHPPQIFHVNWFRQDKDGQFMWPGFGENIRVLEWVVARSNNRLDAQVSPLGYLPIGSDISLTGLDDMTPEELARLLYVDGAAYAAHLENVLAYFKKFSPKTPSVLLEACQAMIAQLKS
ncbi:MAG: phosphoenolpyruvate carboxykinase (GTP) [Proteobacteria bacterium]|nr:phosphoenolpyruvate carboxykinase (GTP) [Pseudomonadota bacterium]